MNPIGYAWERLPEGSLVVDVGGGVGAQSLLLANHHPQLHFVVQDRESVVGDAIEVCALIKLLTSICSDDINRPQYWKRNMPDALESGRVKIQGFSFSLLYTYTSRFGLTTFGLSKGQDFFDPQPKWQKEDSLEAVSVFLLSKVLHDWADEYCLTILKHLRAAAGPKTQLVIVEMMISFVCDEPAAHEVAGAELPVPPYPLLRNTGYASQTAYITDLLVRRTKTELYDDDMTDTTFPISLAER